MTAKQKTVTALLVFSNENLANPKTFRNHAKQHNTNPVMSGVKEMQHGGGSIMTRGCFPALDLDDQPLLKEPRVLI